MKYFKPFQEQEKLELFERIYPRSEEKKDDNERNAFKGPDFLNLSSIHVCMNLCIPWFLNSSQALR